MSQATVRRIALLEPALVFLSIMAYIWALRFLQPGLWLAILAAMLVSHKVRRERPDALGFHLRNLNACWQEFAPLLAFTALTLVALGLLLQTTRPMSLERALLNWAAYLPWGVFQQYLLNGYFQNRLDAVASRRAAPLISAALFSGAHVPNWFLMLVTLALGYCGACIYRRYRNLYFLGLAHGTIGFLLFLVVPDSVSHHLKVGPGWFDS
jgi:membrane protease YdiL (CAAX protease family)